MNILKLDIRNNIPQIVNAYTKVFGEEYRNLISKRLNNIVYFFYNNLLGIEEYYKFLIDCKQKELSIKFLKNIGIDISNLASQNYFEPINNELKNLVEIYIGKYDAINKKKQIDYIGIKAWMNLCENVNLDEIIKNKINFLNYLRKQKDNLITEENFQEFCNTEEYKKIEDIINGYIIEFKKIIQEYEKFIDEISIYKKYIKLEKDRKSAIINNKRVILYKKVEDMLPITLQAHLKTTFSSTEEKSNAIFTFNNSKKSYYNYFSNEYEEVLNDEKSDKKLKEKIYEYRIEYFKRIGIRFENKEFKSNQEKYEYIIKQNSLRNLILPPNLIDVLSKLELTTLDEIEKEFFLNSEDFKNVSHYIDEKNMELLFPLLLDRYKRNSVCIGNLHLNNTPITILSYTIRFYDCGYLDYLILHELCHIIETTKLDNNSYYKSGFEILDNSKLQNPYNNKKRKYERLNETITDMFTIEARNFLHGKDIYLIEPKNIVCEDVTDYNTCRLIKLLLSQFLNKYRNQIIKSRLLGDINIIYDTIGFENFEQLNDNINKLDYLLVEFKEPFKDDELNMQYKQHIEKIYNEIQKIYEKIDEYNQKTLNNTKDELNERI